MPRSPRSPRRDPFTAKFPEIRKWVNEEWDRTCIPTLCEYIKIPNQSPAYDPEERTNGLTEKAFNLLLDWAKGQELEGMTYKFNQEDGRTPLLTMTIAARPGAEGDGTLLMYGHMDKQPPMEGWDDDLGPYKPVIKDGKLYGRGGADDGYAIFACVTCVRALQRAGLPHGRIVIVIEASEESGSDDLVYWIDKSKEELGKVDLIVCTDSGALEFDRLYVTKTLRGIFDGTLNVSLITEGLHSGIFGNIVPDAFRIVRLLLERIEDMKTGDIVFDPLKVEIDDDIVEEFEYIDDLSDDVISGPLPLQPDVTLPHSDAELALANAWKPSLTVTGCNLPDPATAGNVLRPWSEVKLSIRVPPTLSAQKCMDEVKKELERDPPYGAVVEFVPDSAGDGWHAPHMAGWLRKATDQASKAAFGRASRGMGLGGSIPFMGMLGRLYPEAQFVVTGVLGPKTNAHGPNEFLELDYTKKFVQALTRIVYAHATSEKSAPTRRVGAKSAAAAGGPTGYVKRDRL